MIAKPAAAALAIQAERDSGFCEVPAAASRVVALRPVTLPMHTHTTPLQHNTAVLASGSSSSQYSALLSPEAQTVILLRGDLAGLRLTRSFCFGFGRDHVRKFLTGLFGGPLVAPALVP